MLFRSVSQSRYRLIKVQKPGESYNTEFEGFFMDEEPEETEGNGIIRHDMSESLLIDTLQQLNYLTNN